VRNRTRICQARDKDREQKDARLVGHLHRESQRLNIKAKGDGDASPMKIAKMEDTLAKSGRQTKTLGDM
jgi:hypothetical protein